MSTLREATNSDSQHGNDPDGHRLLGIYLRDHLGGASAGVSLVRRLRDAESDTSSTAVLAGIEAEILEDRESLKTLMARLGVSESQLKKMLGRVATAAGQLKSNGRFLRPSPSSRVVELEALSAGIATRRNLWLSLLAIADSYPVLDRNALAILVERATSELDRLRPLHDRAASAAFC
jgi:hypothetical protein